jgi:hypothetical protein
MPRPLTNHYLKARADRRAARFRRTMRHARSGDQRAIAALQRRGIDPYKDQVYVDDSPRGRVRYQVVVSPVLAEVPPVDG